MSKLELDQYEIASVRDWAKFSMNGGSPTVSMCRKVLAFLEAQEKEQPKPQPVPVARSCATCESCRFNGPNQECFSKEKEAFPDCYRAIERMQPVPVAPDTERKYREMFTAVLAGLCANPVAYEELNEDQLSAEAIINTDAAIKALEGRGK